MWILGNFFIMLTQMNDLVAVFSKKRFKLQFYIAFRGVFAATRALHV
jgi:hypothetical protein